ncbi:MAG: hypothetical protein ACTSRU_05415 [Candidatus Hodarchaeales archaeon]
MRTFVLNREEDVSGVSGTGIVASGVEFLDGRCVIQWRGEICSIVIWENVEEMMKIVGHNGRTQLEWIDRPSVPVPEDVTNLKSYEMKDGEWKDCEKNDDIACPQCNGENIFEVGFEVYKCGSCDHLFKKDRTNFFSSSCRDGKHEQCIGCNCICHNKKD